MSDWQPQPDDWEFRPAGTYCGVNHKDNYRRQFGANMVVISRMPDMHGVWWATDVYRGNVRDTEFAFNSASLKVAKRYAVCMIGREQPEGGDDSGGPTIDDGYEDLWIAQIEAEGERDERIS